MARGTRSSWKTMSRAGWTSLGATLSFCSPLEAETPWERLGKHSHPRLWGAMPAVQATPHVHFDVDQ